MKGAGCRRRCPRAYLETVTHFYPYAPSEACGKFMVGTRKGKWPAGHAASRQGASMARGQQVKRPAVQGANSAGGQQDKRPAKQGASTARGQHGITDSEYLNMMYKL